MWDFLIRLFCCIKLEWASISMQKWLSGPSRPDWSRSASCLDPNDPATTFLTFGISKFTSQNLEIIVSIRTFVQSNWWNHVMSSNDTLCYPFLRHQIVIIIIPWIDQINDESLAFYFVFRALKSVKLMNRCSSNAASSWLQAVAQITSNFIKCYSEKMRDCDKIVRTDSNTSWLFYRYRFYCDFTMRLEHVQIHSQTVLEKEISFGSIWVRYKPLV